jgi:ubiquinone/menaquinone biosynthesis C-methylase UbiE
MTEAVPPSVTTTYQRLWSESQRIRTAARRCGGPRTPRRAGDYLGLDLLNGGLREVWALAEHMNLGTSSLALELGCGIGGPARFIAERYGCQVVGLDITERQLDIAMGLTRGLDVEPRLRYTLGDARKLPFCDAMFTHVYSNEAFIHVDDKPRALREAYRVLCPGGVFCIQDPVGAPIEIAFLEQSLFPLSVAEYQLALSEAGFVDVSVIDRTAASRQAYAQLAQLVSHGPIAPWTVINLFHRLHGLRPAWWRALSFERLPHMVRYIGNRYHAALALLGTPWRVEGVRRMCEDIVSAYDRGALRFCLIRAYKPPA